MKKRPYLALSIILFSASAMSFMLSVRIFSAFGKSSNAATSAVSDSISNTASKTSDAISTVASDSEKATTKIKSEETSVTPEFKFITPSKNATLKGKTKISGKVSDASTVEFYLIPENSNIDKYVGKAKSSGNSWSFDFDSQSFPNGSFYLKAKIKNAYGTYFSNKVAINIANEQAIEKTAAKAAQISSTQASSSIASEKSEGKTIAAQSQEKNKDENATESEWKVEYFGDTECKNEKNCGNDADPDQDGLTNSEELRLRTNPLNPDSDGDGYLDGDEIKNGFNPNKYSPGDKSDKIVYESPKVQGEIKKDSYQVRSVSLDRTQNGDNHIRISGIGLPNSFINIYIYSSDPIILTVKTDAEGNWSYDLDKDLENGEHEIYVAVTDNTGKITAKSEPLAFVKTAQAIEVVPSAEASNKKGSPLAPMDTRFDRDLMIVSLITLASFAIAIITIGISIAKIKRREN